MRLKLGSKQCSFGHNLHSCSPLAGALKRVLEKHGLDVTLTVGQNGSVITAALLADSAQIGAPTPTVFLQAHEQGVDLVILASANRNPLQPPVSETGIVAREGSNIHGAADLVGKKHAVQGLGGTIDVLRRNGSRRMASTIARSIGSRCNSRPCRMD